MRSLYGFLIRLHPRGFRRRFGNEMLMIFDDAIAARQSTALLFGDALISLFRRWVLRPSGADSRSVTPRPGTWWLVALCGILNAICGGMILFMQDSDGLW